jgi:hypothetical protein
MGRICNLINFPCWFRPRPSGRKERQQQAKLLSWARIREGMQTFLIFGFIPVGMFPYW